jgi:hypothetical protein
MRADAEFDCVEDYRGADGFCHYDGRTDANGNPAHPWYSGYATIDKLAIHPSVRTFMMGHTHYNSLEILQAHQEIVPGSVTLDSKTAARLEAENPVRAGAMSPDGDSTTLTSDGIEEEHGNFVLNLTADGHNFHRTLVPGPSGKRELLILRTTSNADLTSQKYNGKAMMGFATLEVAPSSDARSFSLPQINQVKFYLNDAGNFEVVRTVRFDRTATVHTSDGDNPVNGLFTM